MASDRSSLLQASARAPEFSLEAPDTMFTASEAGGEHTAARLFSRRPDAYKAVVGLSAEGVGALRIADLLAISVHTVLAVRRREGAAIDQERAALADRFRQGATVGAEVALDLLSDPAQRRKLNALQAATAAAIMTDKAELLSGQATTIRIEVEHRAAPDQLAELVDAARARVRMDSGAQGAGAKGGTARVLEADDVQVGPAPGGPILEADNIHDVVSTIASGSSATCAQADASGDARHGADPGAAEGTPAGADGRGGGGRANAGGASCVDT